MSPSLPNRLTSSLLAGTATLLVALALGESIAVAKPRVAATVPDLAAIARAVAGERAEVFPLTLPTQDPHFVDPRPHLVLKLNRTDLLLLAGLELEAGWLPTLLTGARNPRIQQGAEGYLDCSTVSRLKQVPKSKIDRSMGDIHPGGNPHYLIDAENAIAVARAIARRLSQLDPGGSKIYSTGLERFVDQLEQSRRSWKQRLRPFVGTPVVTFHRSWIYFCDALGLRIVAHLEPKPGIPPNAAHVLRVIKTMRAQRVKLMLQETYYPDRTARLVAQKTGAALLLLSGGANFNGGETYVQRMNRMVNQVIAALKKRGS